LKLLCDSGPGPAGLKPQYDRTIALLAAGGFHGVEVKKPASGPSCRAAHQGPQYAKGSPGALYPERPPDSLEIRVGGRLVRIDSRRACAAHPGRVQDRPRESGDAR
jgi:hypothetical protein